MKTWYHDLFYNSKTAQGRIFIWLMVLVIFCSALLFTLQPILDFSTQKIAIINAFLLIIFSSFVAGRFIFATKKLAWFLSFFNIIDLLVIISLAVDILNLESLQFLGVFRIIQLTQVFKELSFLSIFFSSFRFYFNEFFILIGTFLTVWTISASLFFVAEYGINSQIKSFSDAVWWAIITIPAIGYGDIVAVTMIGKIITVLAIIMGIGTLAIVTALITKIFIDHFFAKRHVKCPQCRFPYHDIDANFCKSCGQGLS